MKFVLQSDIPEHTGQFLTEQNKPAFN